MPARGRFSLVVEDRFGNLAEEYSFNRAELLLGRSRNCDIVLASDSVSRRHARLSSSDHGLVLEDLDSANGVSVNDLRIDGRTRVRAGDVIRIGEFRLHVRSGPSRQSGRTARMTLRGLTGALRDQVFEVTEATTLVGRGADCGLVLLDESVSRVHARIGIRMDGSAMVEDLEATNGVFVNDRSVKVWELSDGDKLRFGDVAFRVELPRDEGDEDRGTGRIVDLGGGPNSRWSAVALGVTLIVVLAGVGTYLLSRDPGPATEVVVPLPPDLPPEPAPPSMLETLATAREALEARRMDEADLAVARVLQRDPANADAVLLSNRIARERDAQASLEAGLDAFESERLESAVSFLVQVPSGSVFQADARSALRRLLPALSDREDAACRGRSRRTIDCIQAKALQTRVTQVLDR